LLIAGETDFSKLVDKDKNKGTSVRFLQIPVPSEREGGVLKGAGSRQERSKLLKFTEKLAKKQDGYAWHSFIQGLTQKPEKARDFVKSTYIKFLNEIAIKSSAGKRRAEKFAILAATGELLIRMKLIDLPKGYMFSALMRMYEAFNQQSLIKTADPIPFAQAVLSQLLIKDRIVKDREALKKVDFKSDEKYFGFLKEVNGTTKILIKRKSIGKIIKVLDDNSPDIYLKTLKKSGTFSVPSKRQSFFVQRSFTDKYGQHKDYPMLQCDLQVLKQIVKTATS